MSVRAQKRLAALVVAFTLFIASHPAFAQAQYNEPGNPGSSVLANGRSGLNSCGDPDGVAGSPPPTGTISKNSGGTGVVAVSPGSKSETFREWLTHWMTGLLQRIGYGY
jgi:hypothetical protein